VTGPANASARPSSRPANPGATATPSPSTAASATNALNINIFWSLAHARVVITDWKDDYNQRRRHSSLGYQAPAVYAAACTHQ
jgi:transposase InsO family protein